MQRVWHCPRPPLGQVRPALSSGITDGVCVGRGLRKAGCQRELSLRGSEGAEGRAPHSPIQSPECPLSTSSLLESLSLQFHKSPPPANWCHHSPTSQPKPCDSLAWGPPGEKKREEGRRGDRPSPQHHPVGFAIPLHRPGTCPHLGADRREDRGYGTCLAHRQPTQFHPWHHL